MRIPVRQMRQLQRVLMTADLADADALLAAAESALASLRADGDALKALEPLLLPLPAESAVKVREIFGFYGEPGGRMRLSRDDILKASDNEPEEVEVPEWGGSVLVRGMTGRERDAFEVSMLQPGRGGRRQLDPANVRAKLVARCCIDDDGNRLFTDADVAELGGKSAAAVDRVYAVAARLSGMGSDDQEDMVRDFVLADGAGSSSTSPPSSARRSKGS